MNSVAALCLVALIACTAADAGSQGQGTAEATCVDATDPSVWQVKSLGGWQDGDAYGTYRVVVRRIGTEHSSDETELQFIQVPKDGRKKYGKKVVRCVRLDSPGLKGHVEDIHIRNTGEGAAVIELDIQMKAMDGVVLKDTFRVTRTGQPKQVVTARYIDR